MERRKCNRPSGNDQSNLLQNGNVIKTQDVLAVMGWKYIFADLQAYDANGVAYEYK